MIVTKGTETLQLSMVNDVREPVGQCPVTGLAFDTHHLKT